MAQGVRNYLQVDLAAKIRWRMRFDRNPLFVRLQDKLAVREYAARRGVATPRLLHATDDPATIPFRDLPPDYMVKANHGSGWNIICKEHRHYHFGDGRGWTGPADGSADAQAPAGARPLTTEEVVEECRRWLGRRYSHTEWAYRRIPPQILVEEMLLARTGGELRDYRFYTFDGVVRAINVGSPSYRRDHLNIFFDPQWNRVALSRYTEAPPAVPPDKPAPLGDMIAAAERLGSGLDFARIDLYDAAGGVVLGEITLYPEAGQRGIPTGCPRFNRWLGRHWRMSSAGELAVFGWNMAHLCRHAAVAAVRRTERMLLGARRRVASASGGSGHPQ